MRDLQRDVRNYKSQQIKVLCSLCVRVEGSPLSYARVAPDQIAHGRLREGEANYRAALQVSP